jgi:NADPH2:quinone reductase
MTAIAIPKPGGPEALVPEQRPMPQPGQGELLVKVAGAGLNRADIAQRMGRYPPPPGASDIPGLEISGEVVAAGPGTARWKVGDKVCALLSGGGYAEYALVPEPQALPIPPGFSMIEAAALPEALFTVWHNVFERGQLKAGETLLVHGGSSGIGTISIMMAKAMGARVLVTAGSADKCDACKKIGADVAINYKTEDFVAAVMAATSNKGADVILDMVGGSYSDRNYDAAALEARVVQIAVMESSKATIDLRKMMAKRLFHTGSTLRSRPVADKGRMARAIEEKLWMHVASGRIKPIVDSTFALIDAPKAQARLESSQHIGKIVLTV